MENNLTAKIQLERLSFPGKIHLIVTDQELLAAADVLGTASEFGFDTETKPSFKKGEVFKVALLQLATATDAFLIRLHFITEFTVLKNIFEDEKILKVGVAIRDDLKLLQKVFPFQPKNCIELQDLAKKKGMTNFGLKGMTEEVLQATISKGAKMTNWQAPELTDAQQMYAATDAWVGLILYQKISQIK